MLGIVYKITNKINGQSYIGQTVDSTYRRFRRHCSEDSCHVLYNAIKKNGKENFEIKILSRCNTKEEMGHREKYYIRLFNTMYPNGYNKLSGGNFLKGDNNPFFGRHHSEHTKYLLRSRTPSMLGKKHNHFTKKKMSLWQKGKAKTNKNAIDQMVATLRKLNQDPQFRHRHVLVQKTRKSVICKETGIIYDSIRDAARKMNLASKSKISDVLNGKLKHYKGYTFSYVI